MERSYAGLQGFQRKTKQHGGELFSSEIKGSDIEEMRKSCNFFQKSEKSCGQNEIILSYYIGGRFI